MCQSVSADTVGSVQYNLCQRAALQCIRHCVFYGLESCGLESWIGAMEWSIRVEPWSGTLE